MAKRVAPGFIDLIDVFPNDRVVDQQEAVDDAVRISVEIHSAETETLLSTLCEEPERVKEKVEVPAQTELQPLDGEFDRPKPMGSLYTYEAGYPLYRAGHAWGTGRESRIKMTVAQANKYTLQALDADARWITRHIKAALFYNQNWTFPDREWGDLPIVALANGDAQEYVMQDGSTATDNHYLAQSANIDNSNNPFPGIYTELTEHPENLGDPIVYVATNLKASIEALSGFVPVQHPALRPGSGTDTLAGLPAVPFGERVLGLVDDCWIVEWSSLPSGYMIAHPESVEAPLAWRQEQYPELRGLFREYYAEGGGVMQINGFVRYSGFSVRRRTGFVVMKIGAASYSPPTGFTTPILPV